MSYSSNDIRVEMKLMILSNDWGNFRNYVQTWSTLEEIQYAIGLIISNYFQLEGFQPEFFELLFKKRYDLMESAGEGIKPYDSVANQIDEGVCCLRNDSAYGISYSLPLPILDLILNEHLKLYGSNKEHYRRGWVRHVGYMWAIKRLKVTEGQLLSINSIDDLKKEANSDLHDMWERTIRIIMYLKPDNSPLLHFVVKAEFPVFLVWLVTMLYPKQICQRDDEGKIPLHYSFMGPSVDSNLVINFSDRFYATTGMDRTPPTVRERKAQTYTKFLLQKFPEGATYGDANGKLPLNTYLENMPDSVSLQHLSDVQLLTEAAPQAVKKRDTTSRLFPFMIPSQRIKGYDHEGATFLFTNRERGKESDRTFLAASYNILRYDPSVLKAVIDPSQSLDSFYEKHLKRRILNLKKQNDADASTKQEDTLLSSSENETIMKQQEEIKRLRSLLHEKHARDDGQDGSCLSDSDPSPKRKRI